MNGVPILYAGQVWISSLVILRNNEQRCEGYNSSKSCRELSLLCLKMMSMVFLYIVVKQEAFAFILKFMVLMQQLELQAADPGPMS